MKKIAMFSFQGELMCFMHVLLNCVDLKNKNYDVKLIIEGKSTKTIEEISKNKSSTIYSLYEKAKNLDIIAGVCKACSKATNSYDFAVSEGLKILDDLEGHPSMEKYIKDDYEIIVI